MKVWEIVICGREMLDMLQKSCISMDDCRYVSMYEEYKRLTDDGAKKSRVAVYLAKKYCISERRVYYLLKKFEKDCNAKGIGIFWDMML